MLAGTVRALLSEMPTVNRMLDEHLTAPRPVCKKRGLGARGDTLTADGRAGTCSSLLHTFTVARTEDLVVKESGFSSFCHSERSPFTKKGKARAGPSTCWLQAPHVLQGAGRGGLTKPHRPVPVMEQPRGLGGTGFGVELGALMVLFPCHFSPDVTWAGFSKSPALTWPRQLPAHHKTLCLFGDDFLFPL